MSSPYLDRLLRAAMRRRDFDTLALRALTNATHLLGLALAGAEPAVAPGTPLAQNRVRAPGTGARTGSSTNASGVTTGATVRKNALSGPKGELHRALTSQQGAGRSAGAPLKPVRLSEKDARDRTRRRPPPVRSRRAWPQTGTSRTRSSARPAPLVMRRGRTSPSPVDRQAKPSG